MADRQIPFSGPMVRAIRAGRKTQTRRAVKGVALEWLQPTVGFTPEFVAHRDNGLCPYGQPGDLMWVREHWRTVAEADCLPPRDLSPAHRIWFEADTPHEPGFGRFRPGMFMPRWASRLTLRVTDVRVERLQDISEADAIAEGVEPDDFLLGDDDVMVAIAADKLGISFPVARYVLLWDRLNNEPPRNWNSNPFVWVVSFERVEVARV